MWGLSTKTEMEEARWEIGNGRREIGNWRLEVGFGGIKWQCIPVTSCVIPAARKSLLTFSTRTVLAHFRPAWG